MTTITADYTSYSTPQQAARYAENIALGLTIGTWTNLPTLDQQQLQQHKGEVKSLEIFDEQPHPYDKNKVKIQFSISYPAVNFSPDIPAILTTVFGKLSLDGEIKLQDLHFGASLLRAFPGPRFGIEGIRDLTQVYNRPLLMSIFKTVIGRDLPYLATQLRAQAEGGVDIVKDDEILFDNPLTPFSKRITEGKKILQETYEQTGHRTRYAVNLTGRTFDLRDKARLAKSLGADALLLNVHTYGYDVLQSLVEDDEIALPILAHPALSGAFISAERVGISAQLALGTLTRIAGADLSLFPSPYGNVALAKQTTDAIAQALTAKNSLKATFPVPSAGIHPGLVPQLIADFGMDCVINAGGGIHGHPNGAVGGALAFRQAIDATLQGLTLTEVASQHRDLQQALILWGGQ